MIPNKQKIREKIELLNNEEIIDFSNDWTKTNLTPSELKAKYLINNKVYNQIIIENKLAKREKFKKYAKIPLEMVGDSNENLIKNLIKKCEELEKYKELYEKNKEELEKYQNFESEKEIIKLKKKIEEYKELFFKFSEKLIKKYSKFDIKSDTI